MIHALSRLLLPAGGFLAFIAVSWLTIRMFHPAQPRRVFLGAAALLLVAAALAGAAFWPPRTSEDLLILVSCVLLQLLLCLTFWNTFYSILWGFSGGLCHDLFTDPELRHLDRLIGTYEGEGDVDRMMARRLPNLVAGEYVAFDGRTMTLRPKGRMIAAGTRVAYRVFSLGMGGGIR